MARETKSDSEVVARLATSVVGGADDDNLRKKRVTKERPSCRLFFMLCYVTPQVTSSRRVERFCLVLFGTGCTA